MLVSSLNTSSPDKVKTRVTTEDPCFLRTENGRIVKHFPNLVPGQTIHFVCNGDWALHDLICFLLSKTGSAHLVVSSFSVSNEAVRILTNAFRDGRLLSARFVLDHKARNFNREAVKNLSENFPLNFGKIHAKVAILWNDNWKLSVCGSGNLTANPRLERGFVAVNNDCFNFDNDWLNEYLRL
jgi:hypothetical protein